MWEQDHEVRRRRPRRGSARGRRQPPPSLSRRSAGAPSRRSATPGSRACGRAGSSAGGGARRRPTLRRRSGPTRPILTNTLYPSSGTEPADEISEREWQEFFDELARDGLSYSRLANIKAVASSIYAWAKHRTRRYVDRNPLAYVDLRPTRASGASASRWPTKPRSCSASSRRRTSPVCDRLLRGPAPRRDPSPRLARRRVHRRQAGRVADRPPAPAKSGDGRRPRSPSRCARSCWTPTSAGATAGGQVTGSAMSGKISQRAARVGLDARARATSGQARRRDGADHAARVPPHLRLVPDGRAATRSRRSWTSWATPTWRRPTAT